MGGVCGVVVVVVPRKAVLRKTVNLCDGLATGTRRSERGRCSRSRSTWFSRGSFSTPHADMPRCRQRGPAARGNLGETTWRKHISNVAFHWLCSAASEPLSELPEHSAQAQSEERVEVREPHEALLPWLKGEAPAPPSIRWIKQSAAPAGAGQEVGLMQNLRCRGGPRQPHTLANSNWHAKQDSIPQVTCAAKLRTSVEKVAGTGVAVVGVVALLPKAPPETCPLLCSAGP